MNKYFVWFALISAVQAACYFPNGTISTTNERCRHDTEHSPCCGKGYKCLSNGLCQVSDVTPNKPSGWEYARGGCTDKTFGSKDCPRFCLDSKLDRIGGGQIMYKCPNLGPGAYVCSRGDGSEACRGRGFGQVVNLGDASVLTTIGEFATATSTATVGGESVDVKSVSTSSSLEVVTSTAPTESTTSTPPDNDEDKSDNKGVIIGAAVGGCAGLILLVSGVWFLIWRRRRRRRRDKNQQAIAQQGYSAPPSEMDARTQQSQGMRESWKPASVSPLYHGQSPEPPAMPPQELDGTDAPPRGGH